MSPGGRILRGDITEVRQQTAFPEPEMPRRPAGAPGLPVGVLMTWKNAGRGLGGVLPDRWIHGPVGMLVSIDPRTDAGGTTTRRRVERCANADGWLLQKWLSYRYEPAHNENPLIFRTRGSNSGDSSPRPDTLIVQVDPAGVSTFPTIDGGGLLGLQRAGPSAPLDEVKNSLLVGSHYRDNSIALSRW